MGIPRFYNNWLKRRQKEDILQKKIDKNILSLSIDMNGLIHDQAHIIYGYTENEQYNKKRLKEIKNKTSEELNNELFEAITKKIIYLVSYYKPSEILVLAVDGVAPNAKISQQRQRRFRAALENSIKEKNESKYKPRFDSNSITPGTSFMMDLDEYLKNWLIDCNNNKLPEKVIYSSHLVPGEGEHKIFDLIREDYLNNNKNGGHIIYGLDADLIMLSLISKLNNIYLVREDIHDIVNIDNLKSYIKKELNSPNAINDFVVISFILGNDFLPHPSAAEDLGWAIDTLISIYISLVKKDKEFKLTEGSEIIWRNFHLYLVEVAKTEEDMLTHEYIRNVKFKSKILEKSITEVKRVDTKIIGSTDKRYLLKYTKYYEKWYKNALKHKGSGISSIIKLEGKVNIKEEEKDEMKKEIKNMAISFLRGIAWTYKYYMEGMSEINLEWMYPYHYAPLLKDLSSESLNTIDNYKRIEGQLALNPVHQLLAVLPRYSINILPKEVKMLMTKKSPIIDLYPDKFEVDTEGKSADWEGIVLIPKIDTNRIVKSVQDLVEFDSNRKKLYDKAVNLIISRNNIFSYSKGLGRGGNRGYRGRGRGRGSSRGRGISRGSNRGINITNNYYPKNENVRGFRGYH